MDEGAHSLVLNKANYWKFSWLFLRKLLSEVLSLSVLGSGVRVRFSLYSYLWFVTSKASLSHSSLPGVFATWTLLRHTWPNVLFQKNQNSSGPWGKCLLIIPLSNLPSVKLWGGEEIRMKNPTLRWKQNKKGNETVEREGICPNSKTNDLWISFTRGQRVFSNIP